MRNFKKALSLCLVLVMLCSVMSISVFATDDYEVRIYVQEVYRNEFDQIASTADLLEDCLPEGYDCIVVQVDAGQTLKDAIVEACGDSTWPISNASWNNSIYLNSLYVDGDPYTYTGQVVGNTYSGASWMFFYGTNTPTHTIDYPDGEYNTLGTKVVTENTTITLSYEHTTFSW